MAAPNQNDHNDGDTTTSTLSKGQLKKLKKKVLYGGQAHHLTARYSAADLLAKASPLESPAAVFAANLYGLFPPPEKLSDAQAAEFRLLPFVRYALLHEQRTLPAIVSFLQGILPNSTDLTESARFPALLTKILKKNFVLVGGRRGLGSGDAVYALPLRQQRSVSWLLPVRWVLEVGAEAGGSSSPGPSEYVLKSSYLNWLRSARVREAVGEYESVGGGSSARVHVVFSEEEEVVASMRSGGRRGATSRATGDSASSFANPTAQNSGLAESGPIFFTGSPHRGGAASSSSAPTTQQEHIVKRQETDVLLNSLSKTAEFVLPGSSQTHVVLCVPSVADGGLLEAAASYLCAWRHARGAWARERGPVTKFQPLGPAVFAEDGLPGGSSLGGSSSGGAVEDHVGMMDVVEDEGSVIAGGVFASGEAEQSPEEDEGAMSDSSSGNKDAAEFEVDDVEEDVAGSN